MNKIFLQGLRNISFFTLVLLCTAQAALKNEPNGKGSLADYKNNNHPQTIAAPVNQYKLSYQSEIITDDQFVVGTGYLTIREQVTSIDLAQQINITDSTLEFIAKKFRTLESIDLSLCIAITDAGIYKLVKGCQKLKSINLNGCFKITDEGIKMIAEYCPYLKELRLSYCRDIGNTGIVAIAYNCSHLEVLDLSDTLNMNCMQNILTSINADIITDLSMQALADHCLFLKELDLTNRFKISHKSIQDLKNKLPGCTIIHPCYPPVKPSSRDHLNKHTFQLDQIT